MSTVYTGLPGNVTTPISATVTGATAATPIVITTSANHLFATGDTVSIANVLGNTAANGVWTITVLSATTFSLNGSVGSVAYTSGGTATDNSLTPQFTIPSDGDAFTAAAFNVAFQALADRTQFLGKQLTLKSSPLFTASGTWVAPAGCLLAFAFVSGGGGGGGGASGAGASTTLWLAGGGGGGGAQCALFPFVAQPGASHAITIGAGGPGGTAGVFGGTAATAGSSGGDTTIARGGATLVTALGAAGGGQLSTSTNGATTYGLASPGPAVRTLASTPSLLSSALPIYVPAFGCGGWGAMTNLPSAYQSPMMTGGAPTFFLGNSGSGGGIGGGMGAAAGAQNGGGGGGGGGAGSGPGGIGGVGGNGGAANGAGAGSAGTAGGSGVAGTGSGGGGGGAGGFGTTGSSTGGAGGAGGSGFVQIFYVATV